MDYRTIKWIVFTALAMTVPVMFFLFVVVMFMPAVFFVAGMGYVTPKLFLPGHTAESMSFIVLLGLHALIYTVVFYGISVAIALGIRLIKRQAVRVCTVAAVCLGLVLVTQLPIYGSGGRGPMRWYTLAEFFTDLNASYGTGRAQMVYGGTLLVLAGFLVFQKRRQNRNRQAAVSDRGQGTAAGRPKLAAGAEAPESG